MQPSLSALALAVLLTVLTVLPTQARTVRGVQVTEQILMAYDMSRTFMVVTDDGNVVIDTSTVEAAPRHKKALQKMNDAEVRYILLTHAHEDHTGGIDIWKEDGTEIVAQARAPEYMHYRERLGGFFAWRNEAQFLARQKEVPFKGNFAADIPMTIMFDDEYQFELGGLTFLMIHTPGETYDHATVWIPELKAAFIGDNWYGSFPNIAALRGAPPRFALDYVNAIDTVLALEPEIVLSGHTAPLIGRDKIVETLTVYRDAIEYVHDETVKGLNAGKDVYTVMREVQLPDRFPKDESYGAVNWSVRGIYHGYAGWFDGNPATLLTDSPDDTVRELVTLSGGVDNVVAHAETLEQQGDLVLSLNMADAALTADPDHAAALALKIQVLRQLGRTQTNFNARSWINYERRQSEKRLASGESTAGQ